MGEIPCSGLGCSRIEGGGDVSRDQEMKEGMVID